MENLKRHSSPGVHNNLNASCVSKALNKNKYTQPKMYSKIYAKNNVPGIKYQKIS